MKVIEFKNRQELLKKFLSPPREQKELFARSLNGYLYGSRIYPELHWNAQEAKWGISWASLDLLGLLFVMVMLDLQGPGKFLSCPRCHKLFVTASQRTKFCSSSCYEVFKVQKYQKKKKKEETLAAQKGKKTKSSKPTTQKK